MSQLRHRTVEANGIRMHVAEQGQGPAVLFCHGWPESWYSWRHQLDGLARAGYHAIAPDMRGYGDTEAPEAIDAYTIFHLVGDMVGLLDALEIATAVVVGHDWGAPVAGHAALFRPDRFHAVVGMSVPFTGRGPKSPPQVFRELGLDRLYMMYFQEPGIAEAELDRDPKASIRRIYFSASADAPKEQKSWSLVPEHGGLLGAMADPAALPSWLTEADLEYYAARFAKSGFRGGLNWYRNLHRNWELMAPFAGTRITVPAMFIYGERDGVMKLPGMAKSAERLPQALPRFDRTVMVSAAGHWVQQEQPTAVNDALLGFLARLDP